MTELERRLTAAKELRGTAVEARDAIQAEIDAPPPKRDSRGGGWWTSRQHQIGLLNQRICTVEMLFPELGISS